MTPEKKLEKALNLMTRAFHLIDSAILEGIADGQTSINAGNSLNDLEAAINRLGNPVKGEPIKDN